MHTTASPAAGNPNPVAGVILVQLQDNYNRYYGGFSGWVSPVGSTQTTITNHVAYVITSLGTATAAQWVAAGVPIGTTPAVGVAFIAIATGTIGGSATVAPSAAAGAGIDHIEALGDANLTITSSSPVVQGVGSGAYLILQCYEGLVLTAPTDGAVLGLSFYLSSSSIMVQGE